MKRHESNIKKILEVLLSNPQYLTMDFIAQNVGLSKRSVQNYLTDIDSWISKNSLRNTRIIKKQGQGVIIEINAANRLTIEKLLYNKSLSINSDDNERRLDIIRKLLILEEDITIKMLTEQFYVSRSVIATDLEWVEAWLASYKLELVKAQRKGIVIRGSEISYRNAIAGFFDLYKSVENEEAQTQKKQDRLPEKNYQNLIKIYTIDTVEKTKRIIESAEKEYKFFLTDDYYTSLLTHIVISISRFINGYTVSSEFSPPVDEEFPAFIVETADYISKRLEAVFNIKVSMMERAYICIHLVGFNALSAELSANTEMPEKIKHLALGLIKSVDIQLGKEFIRDRLLFFGLCIHLKAKIYRLQKDVYHRKTSDFKLLENNSDIYNAVYHASVLYPDICNVEPDEEELLSLTCYFQLSLHRNLSKPKVLLVCNDGIIASIELMNLIEKELSTIEIADCCTIYQLKFKMFDEYDFIISTVSLGYSDKAIIDLSKVDKSNYVRYMCDFFDKVEQNFFS